MRLSPNRVFYCFNLILWYIKILEAVSCLPFWGPKIIIMKVSSTATVLTKLIGTVSNALVCYFQAMVGSY